MVTELQFAIQDSSAKLKQVLQNSTSECISYSGGYDSDVLIHFVNKLNNKNIPAIFFNTGIEYAATLNHIEEIRKLYQIIEVKPSTPVPLAVKKYGQPFISKFVSDMLSRLQKINFDFQKYGNEDFNFLYNKYNAQKSAIKWWTNNHLGHYNIKNNILLKEFLIKFGLPFNVSPKCCNETKKKPSAKYAKINQIDLQIIGMRKSEGGKRSELKKCIYIHGSQKYYYPIFWWNNQNRNDYAKKYGIIPSKCYTEYGLTRTGCAGCPFGMRYNNSIDELEIIKQNEPKLYGAVNKIFSDSYKWTKMYHDFRNDLTQ